MIDKWVAHILIRSLSSTIAFARGGGNGGSSDTDHERLGFVGHVVQDLVEGGGRVGQPGHRPRPLLLQGRRAPRQAPEDHAAPPSGQTGRRGFGRRAMPALRSVFLLFSQNQFFHWVNFLTSLFTLSYHVHSRSSNCNAHFITFFSMPYTMFYISDFPYSNCLRLIQ